MRRTDPYGFGIGRRYEKTLQEKRIQDYRSRILGAFFKNGQLMRLPVQKKKRRVILEEFASSFESGREYGEEEVNRVITEKYDDYCTVRRELMEEHLMTRERGVYRVDGAEGYQDRVRSDLGIKAHKEQTMDDRAVLKRKYKENPPPAGIFQITNKANGKIFIGKGINVQGKLNGQRLQLKWGSHRNRAMQEDWNRLGPEQFKFEVLDYLEPAGDPQQDIGAELTDLERLWMAKLEPYGEKGYNERLSR